MIKKWEEFIIIHKSWNFHFSPVREFDCTCHASTGAFQEKYNFQNAIFYIYKSSTPLIFIKLKL